MLYYKGWDAGISKDMDDQSSSEMIRPLIMRSLRRSKVRTEIAKYLFDISPSGTYTSDIAYAVNTTSANVVGAIKGSKKTYRSEESLIGLNIVEQIDINDNLTIYKLTNFGKEIMETMHH